MSATEQRMSALARAQEIRFARVELARRIRSGELPAAQVILEPPAEAENWRIGKLLARQRYWSERRARRFLAPLIISDQRTLGMLTERQRREIAEALTQPGAQRPLGT